MLTIGFTFYYNLRITISGLHSTACMISTIFQNGAVMIIKHTKVMEF